MNETMNLLRDMLLIHASLNEITRNPPIFVAAETEPHWGQYIS